MSRPAPYADVPPIEALYGGASGFGPDHMYMGRDHFDPDYRRWREEHLRQLDREYAEWLQERRGRMRSDFDEWRRQRAPRSTEAAGGEGSNIGRSDFATERSVSEAEVGIETPKTG